MKHSYNAECACKRCSKEAERRSLQASTDPRRPQQPIARRRRQQPRWNHSERRPVVGSQEWAETRGDDIDSPSGDY